MKKVISLIDLECAHCANKMEQEINKIDGVNQARVNFITQKLTLDMDENKSEAILAQISSVCKKIEPDCKLVM